MAPEKTIEGNEERGAPPQEKLPEEPGEGKEPRGESHPEEEQSSLSCSTGRKLSSTVAVRWHAP